MAEDRELAYVGATGKALVTGAHKGRSWVRCWTSPPASARRSTPAPSRRCNPGGSAVEIQPPKRALRAGRRALKPAASP